MPFLAGASLASSVGPLTVAAINAYRQQPVKDAALERALKDFLDKKDRVGLMLDAVKDARPIVEKHEWNIVRHLRKAVKEAEADFKEEASIFKHVQRQGKVHTISQESGVLVPTAFDMGLF